jgi:hypothetical protein
MLSRTRSADAFHDAPDLWMVWLILAIVGSARDAGNEQVSSRVAVQPYILTLE